MPAGSEIIHGRIRLGGDATPVTDVVIQEFEENYMVIITQIGKPGSVLYVTYEERSNGGRSFSVSTLLGKRDDLLLTVFSRHLAEKLRLSKPLILMLALAENGRDTELCKGIMMEVLKLQENQQGAS